MVLEQVKGFVLHSERKPITTLADLTITVPTLSCVRDVSISAPRHDCLTHKHGSPSESTADKLSVATEEPHDHLFPVWVIDFCTKT